MSDSAERWRKRVVQARRRREKPWVQWYRAPRWRKARAEFLGLHPWCEICGEPSQVIDHKEPHSGNLHLFWDPRNWRPLCKSCHDQKTARRDGGFGNARTEAGPSAACGPDGMPLDPAHPWRKEFS